jgi:futalosine hydrolase
VLPRLRFAIRGRPENRHVILLVPTPMELRHLLPECEEAVQPGRLATWPRHGGADGLPVRVACCGVGLAAAGARAGALLAREPDEACVLAGIAGSLAPRLPTGGVVIANGVEVDGIGIGTGEGFVALSRADGPLAGELRPRPQRLQLPPRLVGVPGVVIGGVLSVAAASGDDAQAQRRARLFPACVAEDMEAHAVAIAAEAAGKSLCVVRGVSNVAGDRRHATWRVGEALSAVRSVIERLVFRA